MYRHACLHALAIVLYVACAAVFLFAELFSCVHLSVIGLCMSATLAASPLILAACEGENLFRSSCYIVYKWLAMFL